MPSPPGSPVGSTGRFGPGRTTGGSAPTTRAAPSICTPGRPPRSEPPPEQPSFRCRPAPGRLPRCCGAYDDLAGADDPRRGFRAHLTALRHGEVTSGAVKLFGIGAAGLAAGALLKDRPVDRILAGVVIAGAAHLVNLTDVRPGAATVTVLALGAPGLVRGGLAAAPMGAVAAVAADERAERTMIGDTGAHALGAAVGVAIVAGTGRAGLAAHAAGVVAAALYGGRISGLAEALAGR